MTTIVAPPGYDWKEITAYIMKTHQIEISGGLGPSAGMVRYNLVFCPAVRICFTIHLKLNIFL